MLNILSLGLEWTFSLFELALVFIGSLGQPSAVINDYQFSSGFSSVQGQNQWYYQQWDGSSYTNMAWDAANNQWKGNCGFCLISRQWQHPHTNDAVIAWKAPRAGMVTVRGTMENRIDTASVHSVNTVIKKKTDIMVSQVWPSTGRQHINGNFMAQHIFKTAVLQNDILYFHINMNGGAKYDTTYWNPRVTYDYEPKYTLDKSEVVMVPQDFNNVGITAMDTSMSIVPNGTNFDFYHSADHGTVSQKFQGSLHQPAQSSIYNKYPFTNPNNVEGSWWLSNMYKTPEGHLLAFCHVEKADVASTGWWAIGLAYSTDNGNTFKILGKVIGQHDKEAKPKNNIFGVPYVIKDGYFYAYYGEPAASVARAPVADVLAAAKNGTVGPWKKFYNGGWNEDGLYGKASTILPYSPDNDYATHGDAAYSTYLDKNILTGYTHTKGKGAYISFSDDGTNYEVPSWLQSSNVNGEDSLSPYETIVDEDGSDNGQVGQTFYVYYNFRPQFKYESTYRWLYRQKVTLNAAGFAKDTYNASSDFTRHQDENSWHYYEYIYNRYVNMSWDGSQDRWKGSLPNIRAASTTQHPDANESVRAWTAPKDGTVSISSATNKISVEGGKGAADGVKVRIVKNTTGLWPLLGSYTIRPGSSLAFKPISVKVAKGDKLYFHVNQNTNPAYDTTTWIPVVSYQ